MKKLRVLAPIGLLLLASACNGDDGGSVTEDSTGVTEDSTGVTDDSGSDGGSDDDGGSADLTDDQRAVVDQLLGIGEEEGLAFDDACVEEKAAQLSDEDAAAILAAGPDGNADLSEDGEALTLELFSCLDSDAMADLFIQEMQADGAEVDEDCVRTAFEDIDLAALFASEGVPSGEDDPGAAAAMMSLLACVSDLGDLGG